MKHQSLHAPIHTSGWSNFTTYSRWYSKCCSSGQSSSRARRGQRGISIKIHKKALLSLLFQARINFSHTRTVRMAAPAVGRQFLDACFNFSLFCTPCLFCTLISILLATLFLMAGGGRNLWSMVHDIGTICWWPKPRAARARPATQTTLTATAHAQPIGALDSTPPVNVIFWFVLFLIGWTQS